MKNMGCFSLHTNPDIIVLFGGGSQNHSYKSFQLDLATKVIMSKAKDEIAKSDRF